MDTETRDALERLEHGLRGEIQASAAATHRLVSETRDRLDSQLAQAEDRTRRHFDVVAEALRSDIRSLAEGVMTVAEGSLRRDAELGGRVDRLEHRVLGRESRVCGLEGPRPPRRHRR